MATKFRLNNLSAGRQLFCISNKNKFLDVGSLLNITPVRHQQRGELSMKKYFYFSILIFFSISCNTNPTSSEADEPEISVVINNLSGSWNWIQSVDSTDQVVDEPTLNYGRSIVITQDYMFNEFLNDTLVFSDKFNLIKTVLPNTNDTLTVMDWRTSRRFNYIIFSLKPKNLIVGYSWSNRSIYSRVY
jgi:hypothetical protein